MYLFPERIQFESQPIYSAGIQQQVSTKATKKSRQNVLREPALFGRSVASLGEEADLAFHGRSSSEEGPRLINTRTIANQNYRLPQP